MPNRGKSFRLRAHRPPRIFHQPRRPAGSGSRAISSSRYTLAKSVFLSALARPVAERATWVAEECRGDDGLRREVEQLLRHHFELVGDGELAVDDGVDDPAPLPETLGPFRVLGLLGRGGMGVVYRARRDDGPPIALKVLRPGLLTPALLERFGREAETLARLDHPGIARLLESGVLETPAGPQPYLAMALVEGPDLRRWAAEPRTLEQRLELLARLCDVVHAAHEQGVVHRDLKPENVLVRADGSPCVLDFGVARLTESDYRATTLATSAGVLVGTVRYMSPEQADARPGAVDRRSDVYSLGVVAHELLSGAMPYDVPADSLHRALVAVLTAPPRPLPQVPGARGRALEAVLARALAKDREARYATAAELAEEWRRVAAGRRPHAPSPRRGSRLPGLVPVFALALVAAFAAGRWLGGLEWFRANAGLPDAGEALQRRAVALLDSAAAQVSVGAVNPAGLARGLADCDSVHVLLRRVARRPETPALDRAAWVLAMELHLRLADLTLEPGEYEACIAAGEQADRIRGQGGVPVLVPSGPGSLFEHMADARYADPRGVMALAASRLGLFSQPLEQQRRALAWNRDAVAALDRRPRLADDGDSPEPLLRDRARTALLGERSMVLARVGTLADSAAPALEALRLLAVTSPSGERPEAGRAAVRRNSRTGFAWAALGRVTGEAAAFDSAVSHLGRGIAAAHSLGMVNHETQSRLALAETCRWRAMTRARREEAVRDLESALALLASGLAEPPSLQSARHVALLRLRQAQVRLDLAALEGGAALAESVLVALAETDSLFPATTHPVQRSDLEIERARAQAVLWTLTGDRFLRDAARRRLADARGLVAAGDDPGRWRRIAAALDALASARPARPDLWRPVPAVSLSPAQAAALARGAAQP